MRQLGLAGLVGVLLLALVLVAAGPASASVSSVVTSAGDGAFGLSNDCSGLLFHTCTLRAAITRADANGGGLIRFAVGSGFQTIAVGVSCGCPLPAVTQAVTI